LSRVGRFTELSPFVHASWKPLSQYLGNLV